MNARYLLHQRETSELMFNVMVILSAGSKVFDPPSVLKESACFTLKHVTVACVGDWVLHPCSPMGLLSDRSPISKYLQKRLYFLPCF